MSTFILLLILKILIPVFIFYIIIILFESFTKKRTSLDVDQLNYANWFNVEIKTIYDRFNENNDNNLNESDNSQNKGIENTPDELFYDVHNLSKTEIDMCNVLGINKHLTKSTLRKNFRTLAHQYHPDKNKSANSDELKVLTFKMIEVKTSYDYLYNKYFSNQ